MMKTKNKQRKILKLNMYKKYRNKIAELLKLSKQSYYQKFFADHKKIIWKGIHEIVYSKKNKKDSRVSALAKDGKTITNASEMTECFNNFITSIGKNWQKQIPPTKKLFKDYLKNPTTENFFSTPTTPEEITDIIRTLKSSKGVGPFSIPTKVLKIAKQELSIPLAELINKFFSQDTFPNIYKLANVIPIFKTQCRLLCSNYRLIFLLSNIWKIIEKISIKD